MPRALAPDPTGLGDEGISTRCKTWARTEQGRGRSKIGMQIRMKKIVRPIGSPTINYGKMILEQNK